jgi:hypothetical protein
VAEGVNGHIHYGKPVIMDTDIPDFGYNGHMAEYNCEFLEMLRH